MMKIKSFIRSYGLFIICAVIFLMAMEAIVNAGFVPSYIIPAPSQVYNAIIENLSSLIFVHLKMTMMEVGIGFILSVVIGVILAVAMFFSRTIEKIIYPIVLISQTIPTIALSPIFVLWFGYTIWSKVAVTFLIAFFPIVVGSYDGLRSGNPEYIDLLRSMGATKWQIFIKYHVSNALPVFFSSLKLAIVYALIGATIGEWLGASEGLGYYSRRMSGQLNAAGVFAAITILSMTGIILFIVMSLIEKRLLRNRRS
ncbi:ABC transporter permease [Terrilactibacillus laevilacticus]|uniref:ABC transporter permease n=1 Tax=Terrilactibacillus laevilacticus TaxID=1380157 RepID=A0ABW5PLR2_9BACI|nr:ABC transporter permease [Terrilactibacillus laevilacticus]